VPGAPTPPPSAILGKLVTSGPTLWADFQQTFIRAVIPGWLLGSALGFLVALLADRVAFLRRADRCRWGISSPRCRSSASRPSW
jgi:NitT/TauT family transport system permease protein